MVRLIGLCILLSVAVWLGLGMHQDSGLIVVAFGDTTVEMPLWLGVVGVILSFISLYILIRTVRLFLGLPSRLHGWRVLRRRQKSLSLTNQGFIDLAEENWLNAERHLIRGAFQSELPVLNYLGAANAAQALGAHQRRDKYLKLASKSDGSELAVGLTAAQLELEHGQYDVCLNTLTRLQKIAPRHPTVLNLLKKLYCLKQDWPALLKLLPQLKKCNVGEESEYSQLERQAFQAMLHAARSAPSPQHLMETWENLPKIYHQDHYFVLVYVEGLLGFRQYELAEKTLHNALKHHWHESWVRLYGLIPHPHPTRALSFAESWVKQHAESAILFLTLGRLAEKSQLWGQAERYFEVSLSLTPSPEAYAELALLYERLEKPEQSQMCYRKGLLLTAQPDLSQQQSLISGSV